MSIFSKVSIILIVIIILARQCKIDLQFPSKVLFDISRLQKYYFSYFSRLDLIVHTVLGGSIFVFVYIAVQTALVHRGRCGGVPNTLT